jgi:hypothetical protein
MTFLWLMFWIFNDTPGVHFSGDHNTWGIALIVCLVLDVIGGGTNL